MWRFRLDAAACAKRNECIQECRCAVIQTHAIYSGRPRAASMRRVERVDEPFDRGQVVARERKTELRPRVKRAIGIQHLLLCLALEASGFGLLAAVEVCKRAVQKA